MSNDLLEIFDVLQAKGAEEIVISVTKLSGYDNQMIESAVSWTIAKDKFEYRHLSSDLELRSSFSGANTLFSRLYSVIRKNALSFTEPKTNLKDKQ